MVLLIQVGFVGHVAVVPAAMVAWRGDSLLVTLSSPRESVLDPRRKEAPAATWDSLFPRKLAVVQEGKPREAHALIKASALPSHRMATCSLPFLRGITKPERPRTWIRGGMMN